jgi:G3E family GTPase
VELAGGCVCCQLDEALGDTLAELAEADVELVIVETTGVADPLPIGWTIDRPPLDRLVRLASVVTVVDATLHLAQRALGPALDAQVDAADLLAPSKVELAGGAGAPPVVALAAHLRARNPHAPIVLGTADDVASELWSLLADPPGDEARSERSRRAAHQHRHDGGELAAHGFETLAIPIDGTLDLEELRDALEALPPDVVRIKGIARVVDRTTGSDAPRVVVFHRVGARVSCEAVAGSPPHRMVVIGRGLQRAHLAACLEAAVIR